MTTVEKETGRQKLKGRKNGKSADYLARKKNEKKTRNIFQRLIQSIFTTVLEPNYSAITVENTSKQLSKHGAMT